MKLKYQLNLVAVTILMVVAFSIALAGVSAINQVTLELNRKLLASEVKNLLSGIEDASQVLRDNRVDKVQSYVERAKQDLLDEYRDYSFGRTGRLLLIELESARDLLGSKLFENEDGENCLLGMREKKEGVQRCRIDTVPFLMSFGTFTEWNWLVVVSVNAQEILSARSQFLWQVVFILLGSLVAGIALFMWFNGRVIRPIRQLTAAAADVSQGRWDAPLPELKGSGEIAHLSRIFGEMSKNLAETYLQLKENLASIEKSREELRVSREQFRALVETTSDLVWEVGSNGRYTYVSPQVTSILGYEPNELLGRKPEELMVSGGADEEAEDYAVLLRGNSPFVAVERRIRSMDGNVITMESSGMPFFDSSGSCCGFRGIDRNITDRKLAVERQKHLQAQLIQAQKMESIGRLAGGVAHDFNNMLSVILGNIDLAMEEVGEKAQTSAYFQEIQRAAERAAGITRQLLAFARKQTVSPCEIDLNQVIAELLKMLRRLIGEDIELVWNPGSDIWSIQLDPSQVDQILVNLCINSRDAIENTGKITIRTGNIHLEDWFCSRFTDVVPGDYVVLTVSDNGSGMNEEVMEHLFEPFFTTKELGKGTGLGLATVYGIVRQNKGIIEASSVEGQGTTFTIYFPRFTAGDKNRASIDSSPGDFAGRGTILLVEDEVMILRMTATMLTRVGFTVLQASSPADAVELVRRQGQDVELVITDVVMPEMNGKDLMQIIRKTYPGIQCLFMSGYPADVIAHHGILEKGVHFIQKPFTRAVLVEKIQSIMKS